jgi:hypothetical protein
MQENIVRKEKEREWAVCWPFYLKVEKKQINK